MFLFATGDIWTGWDDEREEGTFRNTISGAAMSNKLDLWYAGEPNGGRMENCANIWVPRRAWNDLTCEQPCHGFCYIEARPRTKMRGMFVPQYPVSLNNLILKRTPT